MRPGISLQEGLKTEPKRNEFVPRKRIEKFTTLAALVTCLFSFNLSFDYNACQRLLLYMAQDDEKGMKWCEWGADVQRKDALVDLPQLQRLFLLLVAASDLLHQKVVPAIHRHPLRKVLRL